MQKLQPVDIYEHTQNIIFCSENITVHLQQRCIGDLSFINAALLLL